MPYFAVLLSWYGPRFPRGYAKRIFRATRHCLINDAHNNACNCMQWQQVGRGAAVTAGQFMGYDLAKTYLNQRNNILEDGPLLHTTSAVCAAFGAATCCCPFDYVMTKYQVQKAAAVAGGASVSLLSVASDICREPRG